MKLFDEEDDAFSSLNDPRSKLDLDDVHFKTLTKSSRVLFNVSHQNDKLARSKGENVSVCFVFVYR